MKYLGVIIDPKDLVTKEYVDNAVLSGTSTFYRKYENTYVTSTVPISTIPIGITNFSSADMLFVDINGLDLVQDVDYTISGTNIVLTTPITLAGQTVHFIALRAVSLTVSDYSALKGDPGDVSDVRVNGSSVVSNGIANILPSAFLDIFYPVGSYYETSDSTFNPNTAWGGTWIPETEGQVHVSAGSNYAVSGALSNTSDGGSKDAIVPTHNHDIKAKTTGVPSNNTSGGQSQNHTHSPSNATHFMYYDTDVSGNNVGRRNIGSGSGSYYTWTAAKTDALRASTATGGTSQGHTHSLQNHTHTLEAHSTENKGVSGTNKNMQPYINVYRWHRTA